MRGTKKEDRPLLAFRLARHLSGTAYNQRAKFDDASLEKEDGVLELLKILKENSIVSSKNLKKIMTPLSMKRLGPAYTGLTKPTKFEAAKRTTTV